MLNLRKKSGSFDTGARHACNINIIDFDVEPSIMKTKHIEFFFQHIALVIAHSIIFKMTVISAKALDGPFAKILCPESLILCGIEP